MSGKEHEERKSIGRSAFEICRLRVPNPDRPKEGAAAVFSAAAPFFRFYRSSLK